jgi:predicted permease
MFFAIATVGQLLISGLGAWRQVPYTDRGVYIQGAFRGNCGIVGLALAAAMYGNYGLSAGGVLLGVVILTYNTLSVIVLTAFHPDKRLSWRQLMIGIAKNPLILSVVLAIPFAAFSVPLPEWVLTSGEYFASLTLPLALICIGATLSVTSLRRGSHAALGASLLKMVVLPIVSTLAAWLIGFSGRELGLLFLFFASPTAAASFVMVKALGGNTALAANIVAITTLMASLTITLGIFALRLLGWI